MLKNKKITGWICVCLSIFLLFTACGQNSNSAKKGSVGNIDNYPMQTDVELTYWVPLDSMTASTASSLNETPFAQELQKKTGVKIKYVHPASGQEQEKFNLMIAANELTDIIQNNWYNYPGGAEKAIKDEIIVKLNTMMDKGYAGNLKAYYQKRQDVDKLAKTDDGNYYCFPFIKDDPSLQVAAGPIVRADWLEQLGLSIPETIDDWHNMLVMFKEKKNAQIPLSFLLRNIKVASPFIGAYGVTNDFYIDNGNVKYGPAEQGYKEFLKTMKQWYAEKLLDNNISTIDNKILDNNMLTNKTGATVAFAGSGIDKWMSAPATTKQAGFRLIGVPYPTLKKGETAEFGNYDLPYVTSSSAAITTACKVPEVAAKFLDFAYSNEGVLLYNFGVEGQSYTMVNGQPKYTELVLKNPDGLTKTNALMRYIRAAGSGSFIQDKRYIEQYYDRPEQKEAIDRWVKTNAAKHAIPTINATSEESSKLAKQMTAIQTHVDESLLQFIMGIRPIDEFDKYIEELKGMGLEEVMTIKQTQYKRYQTR